jgi:hypothetical protein
MKKRQIHLRDIIPVSIIKDDGTVTKKISPSQFNISIDPKIKEDEPEIYEKLVELGERLKELLSIRMSPEPLYDFEELKDLRLKNFELDMHDFIKAKVKEYETKPTAQDLLFFTIEWLQNEKEFYTQMIEFHKSDTIKENAIKQYVAFLEKEKADIEEGNINNNSRLGFINEIRKELLKQQLNPEEINNACDLLKWVIDYQQYCNDSGIYKEVTELTEADFKKDIIRFFHPHIGADLNIESETAGGKVEIIYKKIPLELKVEKKISERKQLLDKYKKQPTVYASGKNVQVSILCILDITDKINPTALPENNIFIEVPELHGFSNDRPKYNSILIIVIIDGNTKKPSLYKY